MTAAAAALGDKFWQMQLKSLISIPIVVIVNSKHAGAGAGRGGSSGLNTTEV